MIHAELAGKLSERESLSTGERWEDVLTSSVFGLLRYLPVSATVDFLSRAVNFWQEKLVLACGSPCIAFQFWPSLPGWKREPDVVIDIRSSERQLWKRIVVEAKYGSGKSPGPVDPDTGRASDQLADQMVSAWDDHCARRVAARHPPAVVYLTGHYVMPRSDIGESISRLKPRAQSASRDIYWLSWAQVGDVVERMRCAERDETHAVVAEDLLSLLSVRGQRTLAAAWRSTTHVLSDMWAFQDKGAPGWWVRPMAEISSRRAFRRSRP